MIKLGELQGGDEVLFTEGDFRIVHLTWWNVSKRFSIQHTCPKGYANGLGYRIWIGWRSYADTKHILSVLDPAKTYCLGCGQIPSEGLRTMFVFLKV